MSKNGLFKKPGLEQSTLLDRVIKAKITLVTTTAGDTGIVGRSDVDGVSVFTEEGTGATSTAADTLDSDNGLTTLDDDGASGVIGIGVLCADASYVQAVRTDAGSCQVTGSTTWSSPGVAYTWEGTGVTGVSTSYNIWVTASLTNLDLDAAIGTASFVMILEYKARRG